MPGDVNRAVLVRKKIFLRIGGGKARYTRRRCRYVVNGFCLGQQTDVGRAQRHSSGLV
jgi:hypothetical protein